MMLDPDSVEQRIAVNAVSRYLAMVLTMATGFVLTPFLIQTIGKPAYGLQALSHQILQFAALAATAFAVSYERFAATQHARREYDQMNETLSVGLLTSALTALVVLVLTGFAAWLTPTRLQLPPDLVLPARAVLLIMGVGSACHIVNHVWRAPLFIQQRFYLDALGSVVAILPPALIAWVAFQFITPSIVFWVALAVCFRVGAEWFCIIPLARRAMPEMKIRFRLRVPRESFRNLMGFSVLSFLGGLGYQLYYASDSIMIASLRELGVQQVADYNVAQRWDPQIRMIVTAFIGVLTPLMTSDAAVGNTARLHGTVIRGTRYGLAIALYPCLTLAMLAHPFLATWLGDAFAPRSVPVLIAMMMGLLLSVPGIVGYEALFACGKIGAAVAATLVCGIANIVISIALVKLAGLGILGIALGSLAALVLLNLFILPQLVRQHTALPVRTLLRQGCIRPLAGAVPLALFYPCILTFWRPDTLVGVFSLMAAGAIIYAAGLWRVSLDEGDRSRMLRSLAKLRDSTRHWIDARHRAGRFGHEPRGGTP